MELAISFFFTKIPLNSRALDKGGRKVGGAKKKETQEEKNVGGAKKERDSGAKIKRLRTQEQKKNGL